MAPIGPLNGFEPGQMTFAHGVPAARDVGHGGGPVGHPPQGQSSTGDGRFVHARGHEQVEAKPGPDVDFGLAERPGDDQSVGEQ